MGDDMSAYRDVFLSESAEYLQAITDGLLALESDPADLEPVEVIFRGAHSLKGMSAAMGYGRTQELTHKMESLMDTVRSRKQVADRTLIDLMLRASDAVRDLIADESSGGNTCDTTAIVEEIVARTDRGAAGGETTAENGGAVEQSAGPDGGEGNLYRARVTLEAGCVLKGVRAYMAIKRLSHMGTVVETVPSARDIEDEQFDRSFDIVLRTRATADSVRSAALAVTEVEDVSVEALETAPQEEMTQAEVAPTLTQPRRVAPKLGETQTVRISIGHLDEIVNLVG